VPIFFIIFFFIQRSAIFAKTYLAYFLFIIKKLALENI